MPTMSLKPIRTTRPAGKLGRTRVTARKYAAAHAAGGLPYHAEPRERMRPAVAALGSDANVVRLLELSESFFDRPEDLTGVSFSQSDGVQLLLDRVAERVRTRGVSAAVRPRPIHRLGTGAGSYPLRRTQLVSFNHERGGRVTAELKPVARLLGIRGIGVDQDAAVRDLERQFGELVAAKVRVPPHERHPKDDPIRAVVNHLVDWEQYDRENPLPTILIGQVQRHTPFGPTVVRWAVGPNNSRDEEGTVSQALMTPYLLDVPAKAWFRAVVRVYPDTVEWIEPPHKIPPPTDQAARQRAWDAIPKVTADDWNAWPVKSD